MKMFGLKYTGSVVKLYKIVTYENCKISSLNTIFEICFEFIKKCTDENLNQMYKNYNNCPLSVQKFNEFIKEEKQPVVSLHAYNSKNHNKKGMQTCLFYGNSLLNKTEKYKKTAEYKTEMDIIDLIIYLDKYYLNDKNTICEFIDKLYKNIEIDYGYVFYLEKYQDIINERKGFFSTLADNTKEDIEKRKKLVEVNNGYIPKLYKYNILNYNQIKLINLDCHLKISSNLLLCEKENIMLGYGT